MRYDCIIVGGGPAGLSAALMLGRCLRRVLVCDAGEPRNARSRGIHGYLTRDGVPPREFLGHAREELARYDTVELRRQVIEDARRVPGGFELTAADGSRLAARKLLLATGVVDELPDLTGLEALYGRSVHHCPYCDAWEWRGEPLACPGVELLGRGRALAWWSPDVVLCTDGEAELDEGHRDRLEEAGVEVREDRIARLEGRDGMLERVVFATGGSLERRALFFTGAQRQRSGLAERLGCRFTSRGAVDTGKLEATNVPGLYVAGDASKDAQFVIVAAAEGAEAGMAIHKALLAEELRRAREPASRPLA